MRFGINTWAWALPVDAGNLDAFLDWVAGIGVPGGQPLIEVFASPGPADRAFARVIRERAEGRNLGVVACGFNPNMLGPDQPSPHLVSADAAERKAAIARACGFVDYAAEVATAGAPGVLSGPWHTRHMHFTGAGLSPQERGWLVEGLIAIGARAEDRGVRAGFEVLNRFESYVVNTVDEALAVLQEVGSPQLGINWDSSHAHIDEPEGVVGSLRKAVQSGRLFHVHVCENHRGAYGTGQIGPKTGEMLAVLRDAGYGGGVVPELFCEVLDGAVHKWIRREGDPTSAARSSLRYLAGYL
jgi:D-psicose/D-tagatose/L-ribulose 3-epimerase